ncbi:MAG: hypothetical protein WC454_09030, partial [Phycisphaerae bacterium]
MKKILLLIIALLICSPAYGQFFKRAGNKISTINSLDSIAVKEIILNESNLGEIISGLASDTRADSIIAAMNLKQDTIDAYRLELNAQTDTTKNLRTDIQAQTD